MITFKFSFDKYFGFNFSNPIKNKKQILKTAGFYENSFNQFIKECQNYNIIITL